jgi:hypothetical protein
MHADVVVIGGGSAGIAAAISSARKGAAVVLVEKQGILGGMASTAMVHSICGLYLLRNNESEPLAFANGGFAREFSETIIRKGGARGPLRMGRLDVLMHNPSSFGLVAKEMVDELSNIHLFLNAHISETHKIGNRLCRIKITGSEECLTIECDAVIDTTGDAEIFMLANAGFERSPLESLQRPAFIFSLRGVDPEQMGDNGRLLLAQTISRGVTSGLLTPGAMGSAFRSGASNDQVMVTIDLEAQGFDPNDNASRAYAEAEGRRIASQLIDFLKCEIEGFQEASLPEYPSCLGVRESRRSKGIYQLTEKDILEGARFDDEVALASWPIELRETARGPRFRYPIDNQPCGIPLRSLQSKEVENLFVAGKCISTTHEAQASIRVIGTCLATGEAAGIAAAKMAEKTKN